MDVDICNSCGNILRQRLRFCTCCGTRIADLGTTLLPKLSAVAASANAPTALAPPVRAGSVSLYRSSPDLNCDQCTTVRDQIDPPTTSHKSHGTFDIASGAPPRTKCSGTERFLTDAALSDTVHDRNRTSSDSRLKSQATPHTIIDDAVATIRMLINMLPEPLRSAQLQLAIAGGICLAGLVLLALINQSAGPEVVHGAPSLDGKWAFRIIDYPNNRTFDCSALLTSEGTQLYGVGNEGMYQFQLRGEYQFPRVRLVKTFANADAVPVTFEGIVQPAGTIDGVKYPCLRLSGTWWRDNEFTQGCNDWQAVPYQFKSEVLKPYSPRPQVQKPHMFWDPPFNDKRPGVWAGYFCTLACTLIALGLGIVFASAKLFGPSGLLNIWAKKEYIPSQFKAMHYKVLKQYGKPLERGGLPLGTRVDWSMFKFWLPKTLSMPAEVRRNNPHMLVVGSSHKGKSRLLARMIAHDIEGGQRSVVVVDSDGSLCDLIEKWITKHPNAARLRKRLVIVDPARTQDLTYNPLDWSIDHNLQNAASALVFGFKAVYNEPPQGQGGQQSQWSQQTADILRNAAILLMANGKTLVDLPTLLTENDFRDLLLEQIEARSAERPEFGALLEAWSRYKRMARTDQWINWIEPILNRVNPMLGDPRIRTILTQAKGTLDLDKIISEEKILLVRIPNAQFDQSANLLGSLLVTGLKQAALRRSGRGDHQNCSLYMDEFDRFIEKETFDSITSETRRFKIAFIGATKTLQDLPEDYRNQLIINVGTLCCFALGKKDGDMLGPQMFRVDGRKIKHQTLQNIFNRVNTTPQFELITDEEKLNIDRVVGQEDRTFFCYQIGTIAGVFQVKAHDFPATA